MPEFRPPVDVEALLVQAYKADGALTAIVPASRISTDLPASFRRGEARLQVVRIGGGQAETDDPIGHLDAPLVQIMGYGEDRPQAHAVVAAALAATVRAIGARPGAVLTAVQRVQGPYWLPDPLTAIPRYIASVILHVHPAAA